MAERDWVGERYAAGILARRIEAHWRRQGYHNVRAWVEPFDSGGIKLYAVRSNIKFKEP